MPDAGITGRGRLGSRDAGSGGSFPSHTKRSPG